MLANLKVLAIAVALGGLIAGGLLGFFLMRDMPQAETLVLAEGMVVSPSMRADDAIADASQRVGFDVRSPRSVPAQFKLITVGTNAGGSGGIDALWAANKVATLVYEDGQGQHISITQIPPEVSTKLAAGSKPRYIDVGDTTVTVMVSHQIPDRVSMSWDSPNATYSAIYVFPPVVLGQNEAEEVLLNMLGSMR